jgi:predicted Zn-ribbon and HTH transcriptional regulator
MKQAEYNSQHSIELELKRLARRQQRIDFIWKLKSDPCKDCGKTFHPFSMDFDHRDPTQKSRDISQINRMDEIIEEVKKCDLVCANCHRIRTFTVIEKKYIERKSFLELKLLTAQPAKV